MMNIQSFSPFELASEVWYTIPAFQDTYAVSNLGRIRRERASQHSRFPKGYILTGSADTRGYRQVCLYRPTLRHITVHIAPLVATMFHGPRPSSDHQVNHKDGNLANNRATNLEWVTSLENAQHRQATLKTYQQGESHHFAKLSNSDIPVIRRLLQEGKDLYDIARQFHVRPCTIYYIRKGKTWKHIL